MDEPMTAILGRMFAPGEATPGLPIADLASWLVDGADPVAAASAAFLVLASGPQHPQHERATAVLAQPADPAVGLASFYATGIERMAEELRRSAARDPAMANRLRTAAEGLAAASSADEIAEAIWHAFFPEAGGIRGHEERRVAELRARRTVTITGPAANPIADPGREILFTSNVLLTIPSAETTIDSLPYPESLRIAIEAAASEPQRFWYDHPIQIGVEPAANELLYGLQGLDAAIGAEPGNDRVTCLLSVSLTHHGLGAVARPYVEAELKRAGGLRNLDVVAVTEDDAQRLVDEVILPALTLTLADAEVATAAAGLRAVVGVDGEYGRHYSFLKAIAALWHVAIDPSVRATFKIDLDQVFPQDALVKETGRTMLQHLASPLWGATARDSLGHEVELGMLAGALVNERDIGQGLFTPDVNVPEHGPTFDEHIFFSALPQAISTRAEMMERYDGPNLDGVSTALERIHVTGGTNGIRVDALRRHRPFTPSFVGRAEDQAYILSVLGRPGPRLAYAHAAGLIMRHDKEAFAAEAMAAAHIGKLIGDDVRILVFSSYADASAGDVGEGALDRAAIGELLDPFTGGFVSDMPQTMVLLRMALRTLRLFTAGQDEQAREYAFDGSRRVAEAIDQFGDPAAVAARVDEERTAWQYYYDALDTLEAGLATRDPRCRKLAEQATRIIDSCRVRTSQAETR